MQIVNLPNGEPEIYSSIQGEGIHIGEKQIFIRLWGCNLHCAWCDSKYAISGMKGVDYVKMTPEEILLYLGRFGYRHVCITGGEPMLQKHELLQLLKILAQYNYYTQICTNGTIFDEEVFDYLDFISMDMKPPSSGMKSKIAFLRHTYLLAYPEKFEIKVVIENRRDLRFALDVYELLRENNKKTTLILQPQWEKKSLTQLVEDLIGYNLYNTRILPQLHKLIWTPGERSR